MRGFAVSALALLLLTPFPQLAGAHDHGGGAIDACQRAVAKQVRRGHPHAEHVEFLNQRVKNYSKTERGVTGRGQFQVQQGKVYGFSYRCTYDAHSGKTYGVKLHKA